MAENFGSESTQCSILCTFDGTVSGGTEVKLTDSAGNVLASFTPEKNYQCAVITTPDIKVGETYTVTAGSYTQTIEMTETIYGAGSGFGGFGGGFGGGGRGGRSGRPDGEMPQMPDGSMPADGEAPQMPDGEMPQMPEGEMPQMPDGEMPNGGMTDGRRPFGRGKRADGEMPQDGSLPVDPTDTTQT